MGQFRFHQVFVVLCGDVHYLITVEACGGGAHVLSSYHGAELAVRTDSAVVVDVGVGQKILMRLEVLFRGWSGRVR